MELKEVVSSNIKRIGYTDNDLIVEYLSGTKYRYKGVPKELYDKFVVAESKGKFMNSNIKNKYEFEKLAE